MTAQPEQGQAIVLAGFPDQQDIERAARVARVHCAVMHWPGTPQRCLNCGWPYPCLAHRWARGVLLAAGWSEAGIAALDQRTGAWS